MDNPSVPVPLATVLNINDDDTIRYVLSRMLKSAGYGVIEAANGQDGLSQAAVNKPDLILLDVQLPDIRGYRVCEMLKANVGTAAIPVLMISANFVQDADKAAGLLSGADAYLTHPVSREDLTAAVHALLHPASAGI